MMNRRITKPPGGEASDIFGSSPTNTPPTTPRKVKNYMASNIFNPNDQGQQQKNTRHRPDDDSFKRLFGANNADMIDGTPKGKNHQKSNIIFNEGEKTNGHANGHYGNGHANGHTNGTNGHTNGTNGHTNGTNGHIGTNGLNGTNGNAFDGGSTGSVSGCSSGSATPNGSINGDVKTNGHHDMNGGSNGGTPTRRIPPGGYSSKLW